MRRIWSAIHRGGSVKEVFTVAGFIWRMLIQGEGRCVASSGRISAINFTLDHRGVVVCLNFCDSKRSERFWKTYEEPLFFSVHLVSFKFFSRYSSNPKICPKLNDIFSRYFTPPWEFEGKVKAKKPVELTIGESQSRRIGFPLKLLVPIMGEIGQVVFCATDNGTLFPLFVPTRVPLLLIPKIFFNCLGLGGFCGWGWANCTPFWFRNGEDCSET